MMFKYFNENNYYDEVRNVDWSTVLWEDSPDLALNAFNNLLMATIDKNVAVRKQTVRNVMAP